MKIYYKETEKTDVVLSYTENKRDAEMLYGESFTELEIDINPSSQFLFKDKKNVVVVKSNKAVDKPATTEKEEKEEQRQNFKINIISKRSRHIAQRGLNKLNMKRARKQITKDVFMESHKELQLTLLLLTLGDIRGVWFNIKTIEEADSSVPENLVKFLKNKTRRLLRQYYPRFLKNKLNR